jgi:integrase
MEAVAVVPAEFRALVARTAVPLDEHPVAVYLARLGAGSRRTMREALDVIAQMLSSGATDAMALNWGQVRYQHSGAVRAKLAERYAPATANKILCALRGVLKECWRLGQMPAEEYHRAIDLGPVKGSTLPRGRALASGEVAGLLAACAKDETPAGIRDGAMLAVLYAGGLRRAELAALDLADHDAESGALKVRSGKGTKDRITYIAAGALRRATGLAHRARDRARAAVRPREQGRRAPHTAPNAASCTRRGRQTGGGGRCRPLLTARSEALVRQRPTRRRRRYQRRAAARRPCQRPDDGAL